MKLSARASTLPTSTPCCTEGDRCHRMQSIFSRAVREQELGATGNLACTGGQKMGWTKPLHCSWPYGYCNVRTDFGCRAMDVNHGPLEVSKKVLMRSWTTIGRVGK